MKPAQERLKIDLDSTTFRDLSIPLVNNWQAAEICFGTAAREGLYQQVPNPVRWVQSVRLLASQGVTRFVEVGAGQVLIGLCRNIDPTLTGVKFGEPADLEKVQNAVADVGRTPMSALDADVRLYRCRRMSSPGVRFRSTRLVFLVRTAAPRRLQPAVPRRAGAP